MRNREHDDRLWQARAAIGYGGVGAARAIEHLRLIAIELQMVSTHAAVHIRGSDFFTIVPAVGNQPIESIEKNLLSFAATGGRKRPWQYAQPSLRRANQSRAQLERRATAGDRRL